MFIHEIPPIGSVQVCSLMHTGYVMLLLFRTIVRPQNVSDQIPHIYVMLWAPCPSIQYRRDTGHLSCFIQPHSLVASLHHIFTHIHNPIKLKTGKFRKNCNGSHLLGNLYCHPWTFYTLKKNNFLYNQSVLLLTN